MNSITKNDSYINSEAELADLIEVINKEKLIVLDTEFTRQTTYYPIPSIIQGAIKIGDKKQKFIIDCQLAKFDLSSFFDIICDDKIIKILHSCSQDLQIFYRFCQKTPQAIIDTQIMANLCGSGFNAGYSSLVESFFAKTLSKAQQRSDWQKRPLSQKQLEYALLDVEFLHEIYEKFDKILSQKNRQSWLEREMKTLVEKSISNSEENLMKKFSLRGKNDQQIGKIQTLAIWREKLSQKNDVLRKYFLKDEDVEDVALKGFNPAKKYPRITSKMRLEIEEALQNSSKIKVKSETNLFLNESGKKSFDFGRDLIVKIANRENLPAQFLLTSSDLKKVINYPNSFQKIIHGWRHDLFGADLKQIISN